jgi:hypothetical protein
MQWSASRRLYKVDRRQISFVKFILESYDNLATVTALDARLAVIEVAMAPGCEALVDEVMESLPVSPADAVHRSETQNQIETD